MLELVHKGTRSLDAVIGDLEKVLIELRIREEQLSGLFEVDVAQGPNGFITIPVSHGTVDALPVRVSTASMIEAKRAEISLLLEMYTKLTAEFSEAIQRLYSFVPTPVADKVDEKVASLPVQAVHGRSSPEPRAERAQIMNVA